MQPSRALVRAQRLWGSTAAHVLQWQHFGCLYELQVAVHCCTTELHSCAALLGGTAVWHHYAAQLCCTAVLHNFSQHALS